MSLFSREEGLEVTSRIHRSGGAGDMLRVCPLFVRPAFDLKNH